jgi:hypothetical protein
MTNIIRYPRSHRDEIPIALLEGRLAREERRKEQAVAKAHAVPMIAVAAPRPLAAVYLFSGFRRLWMRFHDCAGSGPGGPEAA